MCSSFQSGVRPDSDRLTRSKESKPSSCKFGSCKSLVCRCGRCNHPDCGCDFLGEKVGEHFRCPAFNKACRLQVWGRSKPSAAVLRCNHPSCECDNQRFAFINEGHIRLCKLAFLAVEYPEHKACNYPQCKCRNLCCQTQYCGAGKYYCEEATSASANHGNCR